MFEIQRRYKQRHGGQIIVGPESKMPTLRSMGVPLPKAALADFDDWPRNLPNTDKSPWGSPDDQDEMRGSISLGLGVTGLIGIFACIGFTYLVEANPELPSKIIGTFSHIFGLK